MHTTPRSRVPLFTERLEALCEEAELPRFDDAKYDPLTAKLHFIWHSPPFCIEAPLAGASIYGMTAESLRGAWDAKFGTERRAA